MNDQLHWTASSLAAYGSLGLLDPKRHRGMSDAGFKEKRLLMPLDKRGYAKLKAAGGDVDYCTQTDRRISECRVVIEGVFGAMKNAWPLFRMKLHALANREEHGRQLQAAMHLLNFRCSHRRVWLRDIH